MNKTLPQYKESILNVTNSILAYYNAPHKYATLVEVDDFLQTYKPNHIVYVLLDGFGVNLLRNHLDEKDALYQHFVREITSVFPPTTVAATDAVLSGLPPIENGHIGWVQYLQEENVNTVVFQNRDFYTGEVFTEDLREKYFSFTKIYDLIKEGSPSVTTKEFFPSFREGGSESFQEQVERVLVSTHNTDQSFSYVYWIEPDLTEHKYGIYSEETAKVVRSLNKSYTDLVQNITKDTAVIVIADHGLVDVEQIPLSNFPQVTSMFRQLPSVEPRATMFFIKEGFKDAFEETFNKEFGQYFELYKIQDFLQTKLLGEGDIHPNLAQCFGDFISIAIDKYMFGLHEGKSYKAHHAGLTEGEMMVPLILYTKK